MDEKKIEKDKGEIIKTCLVEVPLVSYYFDEVKINFCSNIPSVGTLLVQNYKVNWNEC